MMKLNRGVVFVFLLLFFIALTLASHSAALRLEITGELMRPDSDSYARAQIYNSELIQPLDSGDKSFAQEIFTGPYTIKIAAKADTGSLYQIDIQLSGLGPEYKFYKYSASLPVGDFQVIPPAPVKNNISVKYRIAVIDDTSKIAFNEPPLDDTLSWGGAESVHYDAHWIQNSLADYAIDKRVSYMEDIYNQHRGSFGLSLFEKIDMVLHPDIIAYPYINPAINYSILPNSNRIELYYTHNIDAAYPRPAFELLQYKLWGYAPKWMISGLAGYYFDSQLRVSDFSEKLNVENLLAKLPDSRWVESDTGHIICGAFVHYLLDKTSLPLFRNLYARSTELDFVDNFRQIYGKSLKSYLNDFVKHSRNYKSSPSELSYYANLYFEQGNVGRAEKYYHMLVAMPGQANERNYRYIATALIWQGKYKEAELLFEEMKRKFENGNEFRNFASQMRMAQGEIEKGKSEIERQFYDERYGPSGVQLIEINLDNNQVDSALLVLNQLERSNLSSVDYLMALGRLQIMRGMPADSIIIRAADIAASRIQRIPDDARSYYWVGRAFMLLEQYEKADEYLQVSLFLENRPYYLGILLLDLGRLEDLRGNRDKAMEYYTKLSQVNAGAYQRHMAQRYLQSPYSLMP
jgi:tetratricopeptide (TPR) repeat protein